METQQIENGLRKDVSHLDKVEVFAETLRTYDLTVELSASTQKTGGINQNLAKVSLGLLAKSERSCKTQSNGEKICFI